MSAHKSTFGHSAGNKTLSVGITTASNSSYSQYCNHSMCYACNTLDKGGEGGGGRGRREGEGEGGRGKREGEGGGGGEREEGRGGEREGGRRDNKAKVYGRSKERKRKKSRKIIERDMRGDDVS